ncbi:uncharacterized protein LOC111878374 isoform X2 [Lactuca sativa]|uniref:uncharacterized protein LOC111878374 isoform X2 n=1 Tax=Lactuca sativa TaxID=4236 RepID=UPI001C691A6B|nr:uncharacterized protein LOC111878374 isoform X2 [Lactuca sativa]
MPSSIDNHVDQEVIDMEVAGAEAGEAERVTFSLAIAFLFNWIARILNLLDTIEMKSQGSDFPFKTHPGFINVALVCLILYGLASAAEFFIYAIRPGSVYGMIVHLFKRIWQHEFES